MRASLLLMAILGGAPAASFACSCWGTQSIGNALTAADAVVVGRVQSHNEADYESEQERPALINIEVTESLKGGVTGNIEIAKTLMCYQSFPESDFEVGKLYVFPLEQIDLANPAQAWDVMVGSSGPVESHKMFVLPVCSHNAMWLDGQSLYTSEAATGAGRRLEYYMPLVLLKVLLPIGLLSTWGILVVIAIAVTAAMAIVVVRRRRRRAKHAV